MKINMLAKLENHFGYCTNFANIELKILLCNMNDYRYECNLETAIQLGKKLKTRYLEFVTSDNDNENETNIDI